MRIAAAKFTPFAIPYKRPLHLANGICTRHLGILFEITDDKGRSGFGEAVVRGSEDTALAAVATLRTIAPDQFGSAAPGSDAYGAIGPSVRAGIDTALLDLAARQQGAALHTTLSESEKRAVETDISVNAMLDRGDPATQLENAYSAIKAGYKTLKLKVGCDFDSTLKFLNQVRSQYGDKIEIRLDCNGEWTLAEARAAFAKLKHLSLQYVEQPVATIAELGILKRETSIPIAADESATTLDEIRNAIERDAVDIFVIKPSRIGPRQAVRAIGRATAAEKRCVVTSNLDSSIGVSAAHQIAILANQLDPSAGAEPNYAHGLGTVELLAGDLVDRPLVPTRGMLRKRSVPGCGVTPNPDLIARWQIA